ncbi:MAG: sigma-70 family RNA polymerase sigma factor [Nannocystaceae bacterium]|nr:sigma-70 family RNA polymerase sigma factor [Nannocystaceae bacterium]
MSTTIVERLLAVLPAPVRDAVTTALAQPQVQRDVTAWFADAARAWPTVAIADEIFAAWIAERIADADAPVAALLRLRGPDSWLACACAEGDADAIAALETSFADPVEQALVRLEADPVQRDELRQIVRQHVLVGDGVGAIARYGGQGPLGAWLRVTASRAALNAQRSRKQHAPIPDDDLAALPRHLRDPELDFLEQTYREAFRDAFAAAIATLQPRERTLLRQAILHGVTVRELARMYGVHHATAARWVGQARDAVAAAVQRELQTRLRLDASELVSVLALIRSRIELSIDRVLAPPGE